MSERCPALAGRRARSGPTALPDPITTTADLLPEGSAATRFAQAEAALAAAYDALDAGDREAAEAALRRALAVDPAFHEAHGALAELLAEAGRHGEAVPHYRAGLQGDPGRTAWHRGLAAALEATGRVEDALAACRTLLDRRPDDAPTHRRLARLLAVAGEGEAALDHAREARFLDGDRLPALVEIAEALLLAGEPLQAVELLEPALRRAPGDDPAGREGTILQARCWAELGEPDKARRALGALSPLDDSPQIAAVRDRIARAEADLAPAFVRALFDRYADRFESDLVGKLDYRGPALIAAALDRVGVGRDLRVLDAGCGTGLAAPILRDRAARLDGFDLSPRMVEKARARGLYDALEVGDLVAVIGRYAADWDLIVAADVLVYVGALGPVLAAAARALRPGGRLVATLEACEGATFRLQESRRYAHAPAYVQETAAAVGLTVELLEACSARRDRGAPVPGLLVCLRRAA